MQSETKVGVSGLREHLDALSEAARANSGALIVWGGVALVIGAPLVGLAIGLDIWGWPQ